MSSSSNGNTHVERTLVAHFRRVYVHLQLSTCREELNILKEHFIETLDLPETRLQFALYPHALTLHERAKAQADVEVMMDLRRVSKAMKQCDRICEAGSACGDMGWLLKQVGRENEGKQWCEFNRLLLKLAWKVSKEERARAALMAAEKERRARARFGVQAHAHAHRREVVEID